MILIHRSADRGQTTLDWLDSKHSFSFGDYQNTQKIHFGSLCVLNNDWIAPAAGFPMHPHRNMEIMIILLSGSIEHQDSMGNKGIIKTGEVQHMSAGTGVVHSEFNPSKKDQTHLLQIWIEPWLRNVPPEYCQKKFVLKKNELQTLVSGKREKNTLFMQQDATISRGIFDEKMSYTPPKNKMIFVFVVKGIAEVNGQRVQEGDSVETVEKIIIFPKKEVDVVVIEV